MLKTLQSENTVETMSLEVSYHEGISKIGAKRCREL